MIDRPKVGSGKLVETATATAETETRVQAFLGDAHR
jgi:hypothetical protein